MHQRGPRHDNHVGPTRHRLLIGRQAAAHLEVVVPNRARHGEHPLDAAILDGVQGRFDALRLGVAVDDLVVIAQGYHAAVNAEVTRRRRDLSPGGGGGGAEGGCRIAVIRAVARRLARRR